MTNGVGIDAPFKLADTAPVDIRRVTVLFVTGDLAGAAADALRHVEVEPILFPRLQAALGNEGMDDARGGSRLQQRHPHEVEAVTVCGAFEERKRQWAKPFSVR